MPYLTQGKGILFPQEGWGFWGYKTLPGQGLNRRESFMTMQVLESQADSDATALSA